MPWAESHFAHRLNEDGTTDSICKVCFVTVANATWEADLESAEREHKCEPWRLERLRKSVEGTAGIDEPVERPHTATDTT
jgi:hypothetical protein